MRAGTKPTPYKRAFSSAWPYSGSWLKNAETVGVCKGFPGVFGHEKRLRTALLEHLNVPGKRTIGSPYPVPS